jgi:geranylgeranyl diphosphate synthase type I
MTTIEECKQLLTAELEKVLTTDFLPEFYNPIRETVFSGGKRIRPVFCMLTCEACGADIQKSIPVAAAIELVQSFSLVHDDIIDKDEMRRSKPTMWKTYGQGPTINMGNGMFTKSIEALGNYKGENYAEVIQVFSRGVMDMCEGQALDIMYEDRDSITIDDYYKMSTRKTGNYIGASLKLGAVIASASDEIRNSIDEAGKKLGLAYQICDDYIDFSSDNTGKDKGSDIRKGKKTIIVCHALENLEDADKTELLEILNADLQSTTEQMIQRAVELFEKTQSIQFAKDTAVKLVAEAKQKLAVLPDSDAKTEILKLADFLVDRDV